jgi:two-component system, NtrC family, sensor kinase
MSVLLVEDNGDVRRSTVENLRELGCDTAAVASGTEALDLLAQRSGHFDVVFSDIVMPGINGIELGQKIRELGDDLPVVLTSGYSDMLAHRGVDAFDVLQKPYSIEQLSHALRKASALRRRERAI